MEKLEEDVDLARAAFIAAHGRFGEDHANRRAERWYASFGETLWWIFALDEHYRHRDCAAYEAYRDGDADGQVVSGLRLARNRVGHQLSLMLEDPTRCSEVHEKAGRQSVDITQLVWRRLDDLPPREDKFKRPTQDSAYRTHLEGNAARYALRRANRFFIQHRAKLESIFRS